jgi:hypothetical protein
MEKGTDKVKTAVEAIDKMMNECVYPTAKTTDGW